MVSWSQSLYLFVPYCKSGRWWSTADTRPGLDQVWPVRCVFAPSLWGVETELCGETHGEFSKTSWRQELQHVRCDPWVSHGIRNQNLPWSQGTAFLCILFGDFFEDRIFLHLLPHLPVAGNPGLAWRLLHLHAITAPPAEMLPLKVPDSTWKTPEVNPKDLIPQVKCHQRSVSYQQRNITLAKAHWTAKSLSATCLSLRSRRDRNMKRYEKMMKLLSYPPTNQLWQVRAKVLECCTAEQILFIDIHLMYINIRYSDISQDMSSMWYVYVFLSISQCLVCV